MSGYVKHIQNFYTMIRHIDFSFTSHYRNICQISEFHVFAFFAVKLAVIDTDKIISEMQHLGL